MKPLILIVLLATVFSLSAQAQEDTPRKRKTTRSAPTSRPDPKQHNVVKEDGQTVIYKKRTEIDFDDSLIEGELKNPSEFYFVHKPQEKFGSLVKKRPNFHKEMLRDSVMIR